MNSPSPSPVLHEHDRLAEYACALACYLRTLSAVAECLGETCREIGGPYRQRIDRMRARLAYQPARESILESAKAVQAELKDYARVTARYLERHDLELRRGMLVVEDTLDSLLQAQETYGSKLREFAARMETAAGSAEVPADLRACIEGLSHMTEGVAGRIREEIQGIDKRLADSHSTDPVTGLLNRREMSRQIEVHRLANTAFSLHLFEIHGPMSDQVLRQAAVRLEQQFRHSDRVARWGERELLVLFRGPSEVAGVRAEQARRQLEGRYVLDNGAHVEIFARVHLTEPVGV